MHFGSAAVTDDDAVAVPVGCAPYTVHPDGTSAAPRSALLSVSADRVGVPGAVVVVAVVAGVEAGPSTVGDGLEHPATTSTDAASAVPRDDLTR